MSRALFNNFKENKIVFTSLYDLCEARVNNTQKQPKKEHITELMWNLGAHRVTAYCVLERKNKGKTYICAKKKTKSTQ